MTDLFTKIKRRLIEPKIFAIVVRTRSLSLLHVEVHYTLEDAFLAAKQKLYDSLPDDKKSEHIEMFLFNSLATQQFLPKFYGEEATQIALAQKPSEAGATASEEEPPLSGEELVSQVVEGKDALMRTIIDESNLSLLRSVRQFLTTNEIKFIKDQIKAKESKG